MPISLKHRAALAGGIGLVLANRAALRLRFRRPADGWRRAAGLVLRNESAAFVLSAFGLTPPPASTPAEVQPRIASRLASFLKNEPTSFIRIRHMPDQDIPEASSSPSFTFRVEPTPPGPARFLSPIDWSGTDVAPPGESRAPLFNFVCRHHAATGVDVWARINHVGADGVPIQELLTRLESEWGIHEPVLYPTPEAFAPCQAPRQLPGRPDHVQVQAFLDFAPFLAWRKRTSASLPQPLPISAAFLWQLARHRSFSNRFLGSTVELPVTSRPRGVGVIVVRPTDYPPTPEGLSRFAAAFNHQIDLTRRRATEGCKVLDAAAHLPPRLCANLLRHALTAQPKAFGTLGLTILKDAKVFGAPLADAGHPDGFIALGSLALPTPDGRTVGCVTIKGPRDRIADYPRVLNEVIQA